MSVVLGVVCWVGAALLLMGAWLGARVLAKRVLGGRWPALHSSVGPAGAYLVCAALFTLSILFGGRAVPTLVVDVRPGPAERAGVQSGDRIVAIDEIEVHAWDEINQAVRRSP